MQTNGMSTDVGWSRPAKAYAALYRGILAPPHEIVIAGLDPATSNRRKKPTVEPTLNRIAPLPGAGFGARLMPPAGGALALIETAEQTPEALPRALADSQGLLLIPGMDAMADRPDLLVRLSRLFGPEVEDYRENLTPRNMVHETTPEIFLVSNTPPASRPPPIQAVPAAHRGWPPADPVPAPQGLAHRSELSPAAARHLPVSGRPAGAAGPGPDAVRRLCRRL